MRSNGLSKETTPLLTAAMRADDDRFYMGQDKHLLLNTPESGLSTVEAARRLKQFGPNEVEVPDRSLWGHVVAHFWGPVPLLLWLAMALELSTADIPDFCVLLFLQIVHGAAAWLEDVKASDALVALKAALKPEAQVVRDGVHQTINAALLVPGDRLTLAAGAAVPADCDLCEGPPIHVDQGALTGESFPITLGAGDTVKMASLVVHGELEAIVSATGAQTFLGQRPPVLHGHDKHRVQQHLTAVTMVVLGLASVVVGISVASLLYRGDAFVDAVGFGLVLVVAAAPMALPSVGTSILARGSRQLAAEKLVVTHWDAIEALARLDVVGVDKTGTLTRNKMELQDDLPIFAPATSREDVLVMAALAAKWREPPRDAIDTLVLNAIDLRPLDPYTLVAHTPFDPTTKRTESTIRATSGRVFKVTKGAPHTILPLAHNVEDIRDVVEAKVLELARRGVRSLAVARTDDSGVGWTLLGLLTFVDPPRHDTKRAIELLQHHGVALKLLTGDQAGVAIETAHLLQVGTTILGSDQPLTAAMAANADGFANVFPAHKCHVVSLLQADGSVVGVTGSDVQDAHALRTADVGVAVDGASDAAQAAADVVMLKPGLAVLLHGILLARQICTRLQHYMTFRIASGMHLLLVFLVTTVALEPTSGHFGHFAASNNRSATDEDARAWVHVPVIALVLLVLLADGTLSPTLAQDAVGVATGPPNGSPVRLALVAGTLAITSAVGSLVLVCYALDSWSPSSVLGACGVAPLSFRQVLLALFLKLALTDAGLALSARTDSLLVLARPTKLLVMAVAGAAAAASALALYWPFADMQPLPGPAVAFVWAYTLAWVVVTDLAKVLVLVLYDHARANPKPARMEWQRQNRMLLGALRAAAAATPLSASNSSSSASLLLRDSFVAGRAVRGPGAPTMTLDQAMDRLARLEAEMKAVRHVIQAASASTN